MKQLLNPASSARLILGSLLAMVSLCTSAQTTLFVATYEGKYSGMTIESTRTLKATGDNNFTLSSVIRNTFASITETSHFDLVKGVMVPDNYHYKRKILAFGADERLSFDWSANQVHYSRENKPEKNRDFPLEPGILDPALYQLQVQRDVYAGLDNITVTFAKSSKIKTLYFKKVGSDTITIAGKDYDAVRVDRDNRDDDKETRLWLVPELGYQLARVEHIEEDGDAYNIHLTAFESEAQQLKAFYESNPRPTPKQQ